MNSILASLEERVPEVLRVGFVCANAEALVLCAVPLLKLLCVKIANYTAGLHHHVSVQGLVHHEGRKATIG